MLTPTQQYGKESETLAVRYLEKQGYRIIERNYRTRYGEIDIIAKDGDTLVFVEVKARSTGKFGDPKWAITWKKKKKISMVALYWLKRTRQVGKKARFDVVSIRSDAEDSGIELVKNAFEVAY